MIIKKLSKKKNGDFIIECNNEIFDVNENTIVKLNLLSENVKCSDIAKDIEYWNKYYQVYNKCINTYSKKTMSQVEFEKLIKKNDGDEFIDDIINDLKEKSIIDDERYKKMFISNMEDDIKYSSKRIEDYLNDLEITLNDCERDKLYALDFDKASKVILKISSRQSNKSKYEMINSCKIKLKTYKYTNDIIENVLSDFQYDESDGIRRQFEKLLRRYDCDTVVKKMYAKGYNYDTLKKLKEEYND